jgi:hypothetical protein
MKVVMINDCSYVGETLLKYFPAEPEKQHTKRTRVEGLASGCSTFVS